MHRETDHGDRNAWEGVPWLRELALQMQPYRFRGKKAESLMQNCVPKPLSQNHFPQQDAGACECVCARVCVCLHMHMMESGRH